MTLRSNDPGSLERLYDIVVPPPTPWWPPAPAWYVLGVVLLAVFAVLGWRVTRHWLRNRYRREGLAKLARLEAMANEPATLPAVAELVKRVALAAFPRERIASPSGSDWLEFLDATGRTKAFTRGPGARLESGYERGTHIAGPELFAAVRHWIRHHRTDLPC